MTAEVGERKTIHESSIMLTGHTSIYIKLHVTGLMMFSISEGGTDKQ
jgi:hypothetical protein